MGLQERRQREREARREEILVAARELLHQKGINGASMNQIAIRAELGVSTLYSYFKSKEDLFLVLQKEGLIRLKQQTLDALEGVVDPREKLRIIALTFLTFSREQKNYYYIINYFTSTPEVLFDLQHKNEIDEQAEKAMAISRSVIQEGVDKKLFEQIDVKRYTIMFQALIHGSIQYQKFESTILKGECYLDVFEYAIDGFIRMLCLEGG